MMTKERLKLLRKSMLENDLDAFIVFSSDPHMSEYMVEQWEERAWLTGFSGSAGFVVVTKNTAALWTDARYFIQAELELKDSTIQLMKEDIEGTPDYIDWIISELTVGGKIGLNALTTSHDNWEKLSIKLRNKNIELINRPLLDNIWTDRSKGVFKTIFIHPIQYTGKCIEDKLQDIRHELMHNKSNMHIVTALDDIAWTTNLRGGDIKNNPVFLAYLIITLEEAILFVDISKITRDVQNYLRKSRIEVRDYNSFFYYLESINNQIILLSSDTNQSTFEVLNGKNKIIVQPAPGTLMKAIKNEVELEGFRLAMLKDGVALTKFFYWLLHEGCKINMTEYEIGQKALEFRTQNENFVEESFDCIVAFKENSAITHYSAKKGTSSIVFSAGSILIDSGGQYLEGTTDVTRTLVLGDVNIDFKYDCTLVLQGMINLSMARFPKGTRGAQLDTLARLPLWVKGKDYGHGTGHGVGSFLNVHEGPQSFRRDLNTQHLIPGMVLSNEPGLYLENKYGICYENLIAVRESETTEFGEFYEFETLTLCPFFVNAILPDMLSSEQREWLNNYHRICKEKLLPYLDGAIKEWFLDVTQAI